MIEYSILVVCFSYLLQQCVLDYLVDSFQRRIHAVVRCAKMGSLKHIPAGDGCEKSLRQYAWQHSQMQPVPGSR